MNANRSRRAKKILEKDGTTRYNVRQLFLHSQHLRFTPSPRFLALLLFLCGSSMAADRIVLDEALHHLRRAGPREWSAFPVEPQSAALSVRFEASPNAGEWTLRVRQQDVKQPWRIVLNGQPLGQLRIDENDMLVYFPIPPQSLRTGENQLSIVQDERSVAVDDIRVGELELMAWPVAKAINEGTVEIEVRSDETNEHLPARITITAASGALQSVGTTPVDHLAVRPGIIYTATGKARFGVPAGRYRLWAGRGFEYSLASAGIDVPAGETVHRSLTIRREVPTDGYVACDTHVHTFTHSRHGDATIEERMVTLAGEGIELPVATDHNLHIDFEPVARSLGLRQYFTPIVGNEVTTSIGHFNVFPVAPGARVPNARLTNWKEIFAEIYRTPGVKAVILNHARDLHGGTRPFGAVLHNSAVGENLEGWLLRANAMEIINSAAIQTDIRRLVLDWLTMLNRGRQLTPVGSSDSHDVGRHFVGQGRTYIRAADVDPGRIDVSQAVDNFVQGRVMVSYGLLAELTVDDKYGPGDLATVPQETVRVAARILGPHWIQAGRIELYANGERIREELIDASSPAERSAGVKWSGAWEMPRPAHDVHLVVVALGPGVDGLYWKTAKPYQPLSPDWQSQVMGCSGAVWLDADGDGRRTAARDYAERLAAGCRDLPLLVQRLASFDAAVAAQAAHVWDVAGHSLFSDETGEVLRQAAPAVRAGFDAYLAARRANTQARSAAGK
jgi:hypothetical protein